MVTKRIPTPQAGVRFVYLSLRLRVEGHGSHKASVGGSNPLVATSPRRRNTLGLLSLSSRVRILPGTLQRGKVVW